MQLPVTFISSKPGLRVQKSGKRGDFFQFVDGRLVLKTEEDVELLRKLRNEMAPASKALIKEVTLEEAARVAKVHQKNLLGLKQKVIQGAMTATARAEQIHEVTTLTQQTHAQHSGLQLVQELGLHGSPIVDEKLGDKPNPSSGVIAAAIEGTVQTPTTQVEGVPQHPKLAGLQLNIRK